MNKLIHRSNQSQPRMCRPIPGLFPQSPREMPWERGWYKFEYGVTNTERFRKSNGQLVCSICFVEPQYVPYNALQYLVIKPHKVSVYHHRNHTCSVKHQMASSQLGEEIKEYLRKNLNAKMSQVQLRYLLSMVKNRKDWTKVNKQTESSY